MNQGYGLSWQYDNNDFKFSRGSGWTSAGAFNEYLINAWVFSALEDRDTADIPTASISCTRRVRLGHQR